ncbi:MAG: Mut7-C RNAse domain-containing protein [Candidatus Omnitrophica bacterium]|nr:Mut7-C RNAse domain-containing protein [Candidatus Omnitrophota bacterium]
MKFILTKELGKLARWLRILGFDVVYYKSENLGTLIIEALREDRIIVTRSKIKFGNLEKNIQIVSSQNIKEQLKELIKNLNLTLDEEKMFTRCVLCNRILERVDKMSIKEKIPEYVFVTQDDFMLCPECNKVYWQGSHWGNIRRTIAELGVY